MASIPESVEYNTLIGCTTKLTTAFKSSPISVANQLLSTGFISPEVHDKVTGMTSGLGDDMKASCSLVKCVTDQVSMCPGRYYDFMALPLLKEPWLGSLLDAITTEYEILKKAVLDHEHKEVAPIDGDKNEQSSDKATGACAGEAKDKINGDTCEVFCCPCGECSLESYLENGCPKSNSDSFPYLDISKLDEDDKEDLTHQLSKDTSDMIMSFAKLLDEMCVSLKKQGTSVQSLAVRALSLGAYESDTIQKPLLSEDEKDLRSSKTIDEAFLVLRPHMSFFNFELLKHITDSTELCSDSDRERMGEYIGKFDMFCKRKVFEVPPGAVGQPAAELKKRKRKTFAVLMTKHEAEPNLVLTNFAKSKIANLLKLKPSTLHLHRIDEGSLIFIFSVPNFVARKLFPLKPSVMIKLKEEGFLISIPPATLHKGMSTKKKRKSWPTGSTRKKETNIDRSFSLDSLHIKDEPGTAFLLLCAALKGHTELVQELIRANNKQDILNSQWNGKSALMLAAEGGHTETVKALLDAGADAPATLSLRCERNTALILAAQGGHTTTVKVLIETGTDVSIRNVNGETALMLAAQGGHTETVKALIEAGVDMDLRMKTRRSMRLAKTDSVATALMLAAQGGHTETVKALIEAGADITLRNENEGTVLMLAAQGGHTETVKALIKAGAIKNLRNKNQETALMLAAQGGHTETVKALIEAGAHMCLRKKNGEAALMLAAQHGHTETVKALIEAGAGTDPRMKRKKIWRSMWLDETDSKETALMLAAQGGHTETVKALIKADADITLRNENGETALMLAAQGGHTETVKALIEAGADMDLGMKSRRTWPSMWLAKTDSEATALMLAARGGHTETVKALIEAGANMNLKNKNGETALMLAAQNGNIETVKALVVLGADRNLLNENLQSALTLATYYGHIEIVEILCTRRLSKLQFDKDADFGDHDRISYYNEAEKASDELFYYKRSSSRAGSQAGSSAGSHGSLCR